VIRPAASSAALEFDPFEEFCPRAAPATSAQARTPAIHPRLAPRPIAKTRVPQFGMRKIS
jgi:hypothetical protein